MIVLFFVLHYPASCLWVICLNLHLQMAMAQQLEWLFSNWIVGWIPSSSICWSVFRQDSDIDKVKRKIFKIIIYHPHVIINGCSSVWDIDAYILHTIYRLDRKVEGAVWVDGGVKNILFRFFEEPKFNLGWNLHFFLSCQMVCQNILKAKQPKILLHSSTEFLPHPSVTTKAATVLATCYLSAASGSPWDNWVRKASFSSLTASFSVSSGYHHDWHRQPSGHSAWKLHPQQSSWTWSSQIPRPQPPLVCEKKKTLWRGTCTKCLSLPALSGSLPR